MTKIWCMCFLLICGSIQCLAEEPSGGYEENVLEALHFRRGQNESTLSLNLSTRLHESESVTQNGNPTSEYKRTSWSTTADYEYGITDDFEVGIGETYLFGLGTERTAEPSGIIASTESASGLSDPTFRFNYRYWGGLTGTHFGSAYIYVTPAFGSHQNADPTRSGNNLSSATNVAMGTNLYWVTGQNEWAVEPALHYFSSGSNNDVVSNNTSNFDSYFTYNVAGVYRLHLPRDFYFGASANLIGAYTIHSSTANNTTNTSYPFYISPALTVAWKPKTNFLLSAQYSYSGYSLNSTATSGKNLSTTYSYDQDILTITGIWLF